MVSGSSFPPGLPEGERARWNAMTQAQRKKAAARISAFEGWRSGNLDIDDAVKACKVAEIHVQENDAVSEGQLLAVLET